MSIDREIRELAECLLADRADVVVGLDRLQEALSRLGEAAAEERLEELAALCRRSSAVAERLDGESFVDLERPLFWTFLGSLLEYACATSEGREDAAVPSLPVELFGDDGLSTDGGSAVQADAELMTMFISGCLETLSELEAEILELDGVDGTDERVSDVRRSIHTLKGECDVLALETAQDLFHDAESAIDRCTDDGDPFPVDTLLELVDWFKTYIESLAEDQDAAPPRRRRIAEKLSALARGSSAATADGNPAGSVVIEVGGEYADMAGEFVDEARGHLIDAESALLAIEHGEFTAPLIDQVLRAFHTIKGVAGLLHLDSISCIAHEVEALLGVWREDGIAPGAEEIDGILVAGDTIRALLGQLGGDDPVTWDDVEHAVLEISRARAARSYGPKLPRPSRTEDAAGAPAPGQQRPKLRVDDTVKVSTASLDQLVDMVGELVIAQTMVAQDPNVVAIEDEPFHRNLLLVSKIVRGLHEAAMGLRMVTIRSTFQKMARLVRDVAAKLGKEVELETDGEDTELDRNVVEEISDPLLHLVRNAIDHGIELPAERRAAGKPVAGKLRIGARHEGGAVVIEVRDDGRGLSRDELAERAFQLGLAGRGELDEMTDAEVFEFVFVPGLSTAGGVTDVSGRGVGMDVVRKNIEVLRGQVEVATEPGRGTCFTLRLPLTLAIIDGMVIRVGAQRYVLPTGGIEQSLQPAASAIHVVHGGTEMVEVRDTVLPVVRLAEFLGHPGDTEKLEEGFLVVTEANKTRICLLVDEILGQQQLVIKSLGLSPRGHPGISGGAILGDGRVALILDVGGLVGDPSAVVAGGAP